MGACPSTRVRDAPLSHDHINFALRPQARLRSAQGRRYMRTASADSGPAAAATSKPAEREQRAGRSSSSSCRPAASRASSSTTSVVHLRRPPPAAHRGTNSRRRTSFSVGGLQLLQRPDGREAGDGPTGGSAVVVGRQWQRGRGEVAAAKAATPTSMPIHMGLFNRLLQLAQ